MVTRVWLLALLLVLSVARVHAEEGEEDDVAVEDVDEDGADDEEDDDEDGDEDLAKDFGSGGEDAEPEPIQRSFDEKLARSFVATLTPNVIQHLKFSLDSDQNFELVLNGSFWLVLFGEETHRTHFELIVPVLYKDVHFGFVDIFTFQQMAAANEIFQAPAIKIFHEPTRIDEFCPMKTHEELADFVYKKMPNDVHDVDYSNLNRFFDDDYPKALLFGDKPEVSPMYARMARKYKGRIRFGRSVERTGELAK